MGTEGYFPAILHRQVRNGHECTVAWELRDLLLARLLLSESPAVLGDKDHFSMEIEENLFRNRTVFAQAVSKLPPNIVLQLSMTVIPDLKHPLRGALRYAILLTVREKSREDAMELVLKTASTILALLNSSFPEAEFAAVRNRGNLADLVAPLRPVHATWLCRGEGRMNLALPLDDRSTGFVLASSEAGGPDESAESSIRFTFPWLPARDTQERMIRFMLWQMQPIWTCVRVRPSVRASSDKHGLHELVERCEAYRGGAIESKTLYLQQIAMMQSHFLRQALALELGGVDLAYLIFTLEEPDQALLATLANSITLLPGAKSPEDSLHGGYRTRVVPVEDALDPFWFPEDFTYTHEETAAVFRLPSPPFQELPGVPLRRTRSAFARIPEEFASDPSRTFLGINVHRGSIQPVFCRLRDRLRHMFIMGMTGTGKSSFMENLILQDMRAGHGLCLVDPHGELVEKLLPKIPGERERDVILLDPLDKEYPFAFNILEWKTLDERDFIIDGLYQAVDRLYDMRTTGGPIFEANFRNMLKLLMGDAVRDDYTPTIVEFLPLYLHGEFRNRLCETLDDEETKDFVDELERTKGEASLHNLAPYITSKFSRFFSDTLLKRIVGQEKTSFDFHEAMEAGRIVLLKLGKGRFGSYVSALLASQVISRFKHAAMARGEMPEAERRPFFLYVDEFQNVPREDFAELLAEARKYGLGLVMANQHASQLQENQYGQTAKTLEAIFGNVGIFVIFRVGIEDAKGLSSLFHPVFTEQDLREIPHWQAFVQIHGEFQNMPPFNMETVLDKTVPDPERSVGIIEHSRRHYTRPAMEVDAQIRQRRCLFKS